MSEAVATASSPAKAPGWLQGPLFDVVLAFGWIPFYAWLCTTPIVGPTTAADWRPAFDLAALIALSVNFIHRHFVYFLFFGDRAQRERHPLALWVAPVVFIVIVATARTQRDFGMRPLWDAIIVVIGAWNIWHVLMQRHGVARAYAAKAGGGLDSRNHGRRDLALVFALTAATAAAVMVFRQETFTGQARRAWKAIPFLAEHPDRQVALLVVSGLLAVGLLGWQALREMRATPRTSRAPRLLLWVSTLGLLGVFIAHGPIVGYIVFGFAHSVEYILFVHMYSKRRVARGEEPPAVRALGRPVLLVVVSAVLLLAFAGARQVWSLPLFVIYYTVTSFLHYFYDGIVWKMRRPEVRAPLVTAEA